MCLDIILTSYNSESVCFKRKWIKFKWYNFILTWYFSVISHHSTESNVLPVRLWDHVFSLILHGCRWQLTITDVLFRFACWVELLLFSLYERNGLFDQWHQLENIAQKQEIKYWDFSFCCGMSLCCALLSYLLCCLQSVKLLQRSAVSPVSERFSSLGVMTGRDDAGLGWSELHLLKVLLEILDHGAERKRDCAAQRQAKGQEKGHNGPCSLCLMLCHLPVRRKQWDKTH